jgi:hypothetical protein
MLDATILLESKGTLTVIHLLADFPDRRSTFALPRPWDIQRGVLTGLAGRRVKLDARTLRFLGLPWLVQLSLVILLLLRLRLAVLLIRFLVALTSRRLRLARSRSFSLFVTTTPR